MNKIGHFYVIDIEVVINDSMNRDDGESHLVRNCLCHRTNRTQKRVLPISPSSRNENRIHAYRRDPNEPQDRVREIPHFVRCRENNAKQKRNKQGQTGCRQE